MYSCTSSQTKILIGAVSIHLVSLLIASLSLPHLLVLRMLVFMGQYCPLRNQLLLPFWRHKWTRLAQYLHVRCRHCPSYVYDRACNYEPYWRPTIQKAEPKISHGGKHLLRYFGDGACRLSQLIRTVCSVLHCDIRNRNRPRLLADSGLWMGVDVREKGPCYWNYYGSFWFRSFHFFFLSLGSDQP